MRYTLGFVFTPSFDRVLLMYRLKPAWQAGRFNGLGGKIEAGEHPVACVVREILEEAGLATAPVDWKVVGTMREHPHETTVLGCVYHGDPSDAKSLEEQTVHWCETASLPPNIISNISWLVPLTIDALRNRKLRQMEVEYRGVG